MRRFNVTGLCIPEEDYMVDLSGKIGQIRKLVDERRYFTINRARQFGKTTVLAALRQALLDEYFVASISFEGLGDESFEQAAAFCKVFVKHVAQALRNTSAPDELIDDWANCDIHDFDLLSRHITDVCKDRKIVLMIDEVDRTSNNRVFLHFLSMLRSKFLARKSGDDYTFQSVILAGVYDIKNIKLKMIQEGAYVPAESENKIFNSPWNIAVSFNVDMAFSPDEIATMLDAYEGDHWTGMDITAISEEIYNYTSGYPFLVSRICQCIDEEIGGDWTQNGVRQAADIILMEKNTLFDDLIKNLLNNNELRDFIYEILILGEIKSFNIHNPVVSLGSMYGYFTRSGSKVAISNRIFELLISSFLVDTEKENIVPGRSELIQSGRLDMELLMRRFAEHYGEFYETKKEVDQRFIERHGRMLFLTYLRPVINGHGFYHIESQLTDDKRMDIVVDFGSEQFIVELKTWRGESAHEDAYEQLAGYLGSKGAQRGYLLTFDFRKDGNRERSANWVHFNGKDIFDVVV